jgi:hypothetical protein
MRCYNLFGRLKGFILRVSSLDLGRQHCGVQLLFTSSRRNGKVLDNFKSWAILRQDLGLYFLTWPRQVQVGP